MADKRNNEHYSDPTAFGAELNVEKAKAKADKKDKELEKHLGDVIGTMKLIARLSGFEIIGRIYLRHKKTGKEFY